MLADQPSPDPSPGLAGLLSSASRPANRAREPSASSILSPSFHFAMRSERANEPTFSPDGRSIAYTARRPETNDFDIYAKDLAGGAERRLTDAPGLDDGPEYSPDGRHIYFNSARSGAMQIWRIGADGSNPEQVTTDPAWRDWFPHFSPDGKWIVFISFGPDVALGDHPPNRDVMLRIMPADGSAPPRILTRLFGGQGTINVPSWSPDGTQIAFVSYRLVR